jgi:DNA-binding NtrC family response regulator
VQAVLPHGRRDATTSAGLSAPTTGTLADRVIAFEREVMLTELRRHEYRIAETARALGLERSHVYKKCEQLGIDLKQERRSAEDGSGTGPTECA